MDTPLWLWKNVLICWDIFPVSFPVSTGWHGVSVLGNNPGLQITKQVLFPTACKGLQNCMLCWS